MTDEHEKYMDMCLEEARKGMAEGNNPVGSVIVRDGRVIGVGRNTVKTETNPVNHAETVAIREACRNVGSVDLSGATLYTSMEPCPMCCWATHIAGIERIVLGGRHASVGATHVGDYSVERLMALTGQSWDLVTGVRQAECEDMRRDWNARQGIAKV